MAAVNNGLFALLMACAITIKGKYMDKLEKASSLRAMIHYYTELTVNEHQTGVITKEADTAWKKIEKLINQLSKGE
jgi:uncharacterized protein (UPF0332 family)